MAQPGCMEKQLWQLKCKSRVAQEALVSFRRAGESKKKVCALKLARAPGEGSEAAKILSRPHRHQRLDLTVSRRLRESRRYHNLKTRVFKYLVCFASGCRCKHGHGQKLRCYDGCSGPSLLERHVSTFGIKILKETLWFFFGHQMVPRLLLAKASDELAMIKRTSDKQAESRLVAISIILPGDERGRSPWCDAR